MCELGSKSKILAKLTRLSDLMQRFAGAEHVEFPEVDANHAERSDDY